jgi:hypothetical protein
MQAVHRAKFDQEAEELWAKHNAGQLTPTERLAIVQKYKYRENARAKSGNSSAAMRMDELAVALQAWYTASPQRRKDDIKASKLASAASSSSSAMAVDEEE